MNKHAHRVQNRVDRYHRRTSLIWHRKGKQAEMADIWGRNNNIPQHENRILQMNN